MTRKTFYLYLCCVIGLLLVSCKDDDINVFDKTADERAAEAIANLKENLTSPQNGWRMLYKPVDEGGSYYVLLDFQDNNKVTIRTDLGVNDGEFFEQTIGYRIDNSLGLELIFENYSFFSFLFEQDQAAFGAEFEFNFVERGSDNTLVFSSKSDFVDPTTVVFEEASAADVNLLGYDVAANLSVLSDDMPKRFSSSLRMTYQSKDLVFFVSIDEFRRVINISRAANKSNLQNDVAINFSTPYVLRGDSLSFENRLQRTVLGTSISIKGIYFNSLTDASIDVCAGSIPVHAYSGVTSQNDPIVLETTLIDINGATFANLSEFYFSPMGFIINDEGRSVQAQIQEEIQGAIEMHLYYGLPLNDGTSLYGIGFVIQNNDGSVTFALKEFTPVLTDNQITFNFEPDYTLFGNEVTDANFQNTDFYLTKLTEGNQTYVYEFADNIYEFHNPCTGWSFVFVNGNQ
jgi:hypothetical protein